MSFSHAKVEAFREKSLRRGELASPATSPLVELGGFGGGEGVGGSDGGVMEFLTLGGGAASVVGSVEEMFLSEKDAPHNVGKLDSVKLVFPHQINGAGGVYETWNWNLCLLRGVDWRASCWKPTVFAPKL
jgi:hypothetical protein